MKTDTLQDSLDIYRDKVGGKRRNAAAAYELALKSSRAYVAGDQISYYVTGRGTQSEGRDCGEAGREYDPGRPDENIEYYQAKLTDLFEKFRVFAEKARIVRGRGTRKGRRRNRRGLAAGLFHIDKPLEK